MKRIILIALFLMGGFAAKAQTPHLFEHTYPVIAAEDPEIRALMDSVSVNNIEATVAHLSSYHNRRYDSRYIWDVQNWLVSRYQQMGFDMVALHNFPIPDSDIETADNVLAIKWGTKTPQEYVICGAHYDSWNADGTDPDTIRSPGADDNASGVAGIMETARILSNYTFDRTLVFANWCAEEIGLIGSAAYAADCAEAHMDIVGYFNLDMIGYLEEDTDLHVHLMYTTRDSLIANYVYNFSHVYFPDMPICQNWLAWGDSDYSSFNRNGYPAVHPFEDVHASSPFIHSRQDVLGLSVNNLEQSKRFTELNLGLVATLAGINYDGISENEEIQVAMYPNPAQDAVNISAEEGLRHIEICNPWGQIVATIELDGENQCTVGTNHYTSGIYIVKITTENSVVAKRLMISN